MSEKPNDFLLTRRQIELTVLLRAFVRESNPVVLAALTTRIQQLLDAGFKPLPGYSEEVLALLTGNPQKFA